jgi:hypothetical protein
MRLRNGLFWSLIFAWLVVVAGVDIPSGLRRAIGAWFTGPGVLTADVLHQQEDTAGATEYHGDGMDATPKIDYGPELVRRHLASSQCLSGQRCNSPAPNGVSAVSPNVDSVGDCETFCVNNFAATYFNLAIGTSCQCYTNPCNTFQVNAAFSVYAIDPVS